MSHKERERDRGGRFRCQGTSIGTCEGSRGQNSCPLSVLMGTMLRGCPLHRRHLAGCQSQIGLLMSLTIKFWVASLVSENQSPNFLPIGKLVYLYSVFFFFLGHSTLFVLNFNKLKSPQIRLEEKPSPLTLLEMSILANFSPQTRSPHTLESAPSCCPGGIFPY